MSFLINPYSFGVAFENLYSNDLDGSNEYADAGDNNAFSFGNGAGTDTPFTLLCWMKMDVTAANQNLLSKFSAGATEYDLSITNTNTLRLVCWTAATTAFIGRSAPMSTTGTWLCIVGTYDASKASSGIKLYSFTSGGAVTQIDNGNVTSGVYSTTGMSNTATSLKIGSIVSASFFFNGKLYHPQVYSAALTSAQLAEISAAPRKDCRTYSFGANAISAWKFNNGTADFATWTDYVNGRNATMTNQESADINVDIP